MTIPALTPEIKFDQISNFKIYEIEIKKIINLVTPNFIKIYETPSFYGCMVPFMTGMFEFVFHPKASHMEMKTDESAPSHSIYPLVDVHIAIENGPVEIVDLPIKNCMVIFHSCLYVYQRVNLHFPMVFLVTTCELMMFMMFMCARLKPHMETGHPRTKWRF